MKLGKIISIEYVSGQSVAVPKARVMSVMAIDAVPKDVKYHDLVSIRWEIF